MSLLLGIKFTVEETWRKMDSTEAKNSESLTSNVGNESEAVVKKTGVFIYCIVYTTKFHGILFYSIFP